MIPFPSLFSICELQIVLLFLLARYYLVNMARIQRKLENYNSLMSFRLKLTEIRLFSAQSYVDDCRQATELHEPRSRQKL